MVERAITGPVNDPGRSTSQATQAAIEAETNEDTYAPPDLIQHSPGVAKVWAKFLPTGVIQADKGVDTVTDLAVGRWRVNFTTAFSSTHYAVIPQTSKEDLQLRLGHIEAILTTSTTIRCMDASVILVDPNNIYLAAFGDQ